jgi:CRP-like cAMP-binding protein
MKNRYNCDTPVTQLIYSAPFFQGLPQAAVEKAMSHFFTRTLLANQVIIQENDWDSSVYFILEGWVKVCTYNADGKQVTLNILGKGELFGEMAVLDEAPRSTDVITLTPTLMGNMPARDFAELIHSEPLVGFNLLKLMMRRLRQVNRRCQRRESNSMSRVADTLLFLAEGEEIHDQTGTSIPKLAHHELSSISGLARETVSRVLIKLENKGLIVRNQQTLCIPNLQALERLIV